MRHSSRTNHLTFQRVEIQLMGSFTFEKRKFGKVIIPVLVWTLISKTSFSEKAHTCTVMKLKVIEWFFLFFNTL